MSTPRYQPESDQGSRGSSTVLREVKPVYFITLKWFIATRAVGKYELNFVQALLRIYNKYKAAHPHNSLREKALKEKILQCYVIATRLSKIPDLRMAVVKNLARPNTILRLAIIEQIFNVAKIFRNLESICVLFQDSYTALNNTIGKFISEEERELVFELYSLFGGIRFVTFFMQQGGIEEDRAQVGACLQLISNFAESEGSKQALGYLVQGMKVKIANLSRLLEAPDLLMYLKEDLISSDIVAWLMERNPGYHNNLKFHATVEDFKNITSRSLMKTRVFLIYQAHLSSNAVARISTPDEESLATIRKMIKDEVFSRGMFAHLQAQVMIPILDDFNTNFKNSYLYKRILDDLECLRLRLGAFLLNMNERQAVDEEDEDDGEGRETVSASTAVSAVPGGGGGGGSAGGGTGGGQCIDNRGQSVTGGSRRSVYERLSFWG